MRRVGALIFPGFELLDLFGPLELLGLMTEHFQLTLVAERAGSIRSNQQVSVVAETDIKSNQEYDVILVPGGQGTRREIGNPALLEWIQFSAEKAEYVLSVCTGSALLARASVLNNRRATTNKAAFSWVAQQGPDVIWQKSARWVEDGKFISSSGVSAGMDMTLGAIALMHGEDMADRVAVISEYQWNKDRDWDPFSSIHGLS